MACEKATNKFEKITQGFFDETLKAMKGVETVIIETYMDNFRAGTMSVDKLTDEVYDKLNGYIQNEVLGMPAPSKEIGKDLLRREIEGYHGISRGLLEQTFEDHRPTNEVFDQLAKLACQNVAQRLYSRAYGEIKRLAIEDFQGFRDYMSALSAQSGLKADKNSMAYVEGMLEIYGKLVSFALKERISN